jgi:stabilization protein
VKAQLSLQAFSRPSTGLAELACLNTFAEETPFGVATLFRPPLSSRATAGEGPIRGVFRQKGVYAGSTFSVSGQQLYRGTAPVGALTGRSLVRWAASDTQVVAVDPGQGFAWVYQGGGVKRIADPDLPAVIDAKILAGRLYFAEAASGRLWFSQIGEATDVDGLAFFTAESRPDRIVALETLGPALAVLGQETTEFWSTGGGADAPLVFSRRYDTGCAAQASVLAMDNGLLWVGADRAVYRTNGDTPQKISTPSVDERLRRCGDRLGDCSAFPAAIDGHVFYGLNIPGQGTWVHGVQGRGWAQWGSLGRETLRVGCGVMSDGEAYLGDDETGVIWKFGEGQYLDGSERIERRWSAYLAAEGRGRIPPISLQAVMGQGAHVAPVVEMRLTRNGRDWSAWDPRALGVQGDRDHKAVWRRKGVMDSRGVVLEWRTTENLTSAVVGLSLEDRP